MVVGEVGEMVEEETCDGGDGGGSGDSDDYEGQEHFHYWQGQTKLQNLVPSALSIPTYQLLIRLLPSSANP